MWGAFDRGTAIVQLVIQWSECPQLPSLSTVTPLVVLSGRTTEVVTAGSRTTGRLRLILGTMVAPLASQFLMPNGTFVVLVLVMLPVFALLVVWPLVETVVRQQWGYTLGVVLLGPIGGLAWLLVGRRETARDGRVLNRTTI
jgi:hypothetical protein